MATPLLPAAAPGFWSLIGMAAMMGGTMRAPLTATFFAVEVTGDLDAALPLLVACGIAHATTVLLLKRSLLTEKIARRGLHISREYQADPLDLTLIEHVMTTQVDTVPATWTVGETIDFFLAATHRHKSYPVLDGRGIVLNMVSWADILAWVGQGKAIDRRQSLADNLDATALVSGHARETVGHLIDRMAETGSGRVPILDPDGRLVGLVTRKDLLKARANRVAEDSDHAIHLRLYPKAG